MKCIFGNVAFAMLSSFACQSSPAFVDSCVPNCCEQRHEVHQWLGYRYYDPKTGKWLTADPLAEAGGANQTAFCNNDPVNNTDPLGLATVEQCQEEIADAIRKQIHIRQSLKNYLDVAAAFKSGAEQFPNVLDDSTGKITPLPFNLRQTWIMLRALEIHGDGNAMRPERAAFALVGEKARQSNAQYNLERLYLNAAFLEGFDGLKPGAISPEHQNFFNTDNADFLASERRAFWASINPASDIDRHAVSGEYGQAATAFGRETALACACLVGGEFLQAGRVSVGLGFRTPLTTRIAEWYMRGSENDATWRALSLEDKLYYEIGQKTLSTFPTELAGQTAVQRGQLFMKQGWRRAWIPEGAGWRLGYGATLDTGPTPLFRWLVPRATAGAAGWAGYSLWRDE